MSLVRPSITPRLGRCKTVAISLMERELALVAFISIVYIFSEERLLRMPSGGVIASISGVRCMSPLRMVYTIVGHVSAYGASSSETLVDSGW